MARNKGTFNFSANLEVRTAAPLDPRLVVDTYADLTKLETWDGGDGKAWVYDGMVVTVKDTHKQYMLTGQDPITAPTAYQSAANWVQTDATAAKITVNDTLTSTSTTEPLAANQGKVLKGLVDGVDAKVAELKTSLGGALRYMGSKDTYAALPATGNTKGDVWNVVAANGNIPAGTNYAWDGTKWDALGGTVDLSGYYTKTQTDSAIQKAVEGVVAGDLSESLTEINGKIADHNTRIAAAEQKLAVIQGTGDGSITKAVSTAKEELTLEITDQIDSLKETLQLETKLEKVDTLETNLTELTKRVENNEGTLEVLVGSDASKSVRTIATEVAEGLLEWEEVNT